jgi:hypothetical protein
VNGTHARPLTAYAALCAAAVVVLAQGVGSPDPVSEAVARAGRPVALYAHTVTLTAADQVREGVNQLGAAVASTVLPAVGGSGSQPGSERAASSSSSAVTTTARVAAPVSIAPATSSLRVTAAAPAPTHAATPKAHPAHRAAARDARKAGRAAAKRLPAARRSAPHGR